MLGRIQTPEVAGRDGRNDQFVGVTHHGTRRQRSGAEARAVGS